ncbi:hypothetical protein HanIR_Chr01g0027031 [Helianthus annuus]|nr:hypothetical protein HanIR_Chr01g0027031 [Helianthus annuus]
MSSVFYSCFEGPKTPLRFFFLFSFYIRICNILIKGCGKNGGETRRGRPNFLSSHNL